ncbi:MAG: ABC transporter ATP-binding protein, partial [Chloroflexi bacterium]|nr:ABC transporter ATP-binding protein [Chloroflexota bacterium]
MKTRWYIWQLARFRLGHFLLSGLLAGVISYVFPLVPGLIVRQVFDVLSGSSQASFGLWGLLALLVGVAIVRVMILFGGITAEMSLRLIVAALLRQNLLNSILRRPGAQALPASPGEAISRFRDDVLAVVEFLTWTFDPVGQGIVALVALVILMRVNLFITLTVILPLVIMLTLGNMAARRIQKYRQASRSALGEVTGLLGEIFGAVQAVKVAGAETQVVNHLKTLNEVRRKATLNDLLLTELLRSVSVNAANLGIGTLLLLAAQPMQAGRFTVGDLALFVSYLGWLTQLTSSFTEFLTKYRQVGVSFDRLAALLPDASPETLVAHSPIYMTGDLPPVPYTPKNANHHLAALEVSGLTYRYPNSDRGIQGINLRLERGSFTVITGRIGSGKTTLLRVLLGLLPREAGDIRWNGQSVADPAAFLAPPRCAYTPQMPRLFSEPMRDNILMGLPEDQVDISAAIRLAALERDVLALEQGLDTLVGPRGVRLSGGQVQRTAAARMMVRGPELLVFDDLSSALDVETERTLWEGLCAWRANPETTVTWLAVSHRRQALMLADHIIFLKDGKV